jgi:glycosyltransferase involved in cell wall biosynthesis
MRGRGEQNGVKVSVVMLTYNHGPFIADAIEGFLMQKTDFPCELVIAEDCSTDDTRAVIRTYWERYPDRIRVLLNRRNIGGRQTNLRGYQYCRGQYVASLDGDDYWVSPDKLQRQADFLDAHPDYALCFHSVRMVWEDGSHEDTVFRPRIIKDSYTLEELLEYNFIGACSPMYRKGVFDAYPHWYFVMPVGDWAVHVLHALSGDIGYLDEPMGVYRQHDKAMYSVTGATERIRLAIEMLRRFRCGLGKDYRRVTNRSLCRHYDKLVRQYYDEGDVPEARRCARECFQDVGLGPDTPLSDMVKVMLRMLAPGLRRKPTLVVPKA